MAMLGYVNLQTFYLHAGRIPKRYQKDTGRVTDIR